MLLKDRTYGISALIDIAQMPSGATASTAEIAERHDLADELLDEVLIGLYKSGILLSKSRQTGCFALSRSASEIKLGDVLRTLEPPSASVSCRRSMATESCTCCATPEACQFRLAIGHVRDNITTMPDETSLAALSSAPSISPMSLFAPSSHQEIRRVVFEPLDQAEIL